MVCTSVLGIISGLTAAQIWVIMINLYFYILIINIYSKINDNIFLYPCTITNKIFLIKTFSIIPSSAMRLKSVKNYVKIMGTSLAIIFALTVYHMHFVRSVDMKITRITKSWNSMTRTNLNLRQSKFYFKLLKKL